MNQKDRKNAVQIPKDGVNPDKIREKETPMRVAPRLEGVVKNAGIKNVKKPKKN